MTPAVEAKDLFRVYATREGSAAALQGLSLEIAEGEIVVVFGPSGSGKTTLLRATVAGRSLVAVRLLPRKRTRSADGGWASADEPPSPRAAAMASTPARRITAGRYPSPTG